MKEESLSRKEYKGIRLDSNSKGRKNGKSMKSVKVGPKPKSAENWLGLLDDGTSLVEVRIASSSSSDESASTLDQSKSSEKIVWRPDDFEVHEILKDF